MTLLLTTLSATEKVVRWDTLKTMIPPAAERSVQRLLGHPSNVPESEGSTSIAGLMMLVFWNRRSAVWFNPGNKVELTKMVVLVNRIPVSKAIVIVALTGPV